MQLKGGKRYLLSFDISLSEERLNTYTAQVKKAKPTGKPAACRDWLRTLRVYAEYTYNNKWNELMLTDRESIADCCLEVLGDSLFSRFFTRYTGEIVCTPARIMTAYTALKRFRTAQNNVHNEIASTYDEYLLTDIVMVMPDEDALEQLTLIYAFAVWYDLFGDDSALAVQINKTNTWADVDIPLYLVPIFAPYFAGSKQIKNVNCYDPRKFLSNDVCTVLRMYVDAPILHNKKIMRDLFYTGVDMSGIQHTTYDCIENTALYYNGHLCDVMREFSQLDVENLVKETKQLQEERAGAHLERIKDNTGFRILYGKDGVCVYTQTEKNTNICEYTPEQVFMLSTTDCPLFRANS